MAYNARNLSVLAYANGFTLWHYRTEDHSGYVLSEGYFAGARDMLRVGDMIFANTGDGNEAFFVKGRTVGIEE